MSTFWGAGAAHRVGCGRLEFAARSELGGARAGVATGERGAGVDLVEVALGTARRRIGGELVEVASTAVGAVAAPEAAPVGDHLGGGAYEPGGRAAGRRAQRGGGGAGGATDGTSDGFRRFRSRPVISSLAWDPAASLVVEPAMSDLDDAPGLAWFGAGTHQARWPPVGGRSAASCSSRSRSADVLPATTCRGRARHASSAAVAGRRRIVRGSRA